MFLFCHAFSFRNAPPLCLIPHPSTLPHSASIYLCVYLSLDICLLLSLSLSFTFSVCLSVSLSLSLCLSLSLSVSVCVFLSLSLTLSLSLSLSLSVSLSLSLWVSVMYPLTLVLGLLCLFCLQLFHCPRNVFIDFVQKKLHSICCHHNIHTLGSHCSVSDPHSSVLGKLLLVHCSVHSVTQTL